MLDKIRLHRDGKLPPAWVDAKGSIKGLDGRCCRFLHVDYAALEAEVLRGRSDEQMFLRVQSHGRIPNAEEIEVWNGFMMKLGWRDKIAERVHARLEEAGLPPDAVKTMFDFIEIDEGRPPRFR